MKVMELREALADMPGEMSVYLVGGRGVAEASHIFRGNLVGVEQFCELRTYFEDHTPQFQDSKIERETGFQDRLELIDAYKKLLALTTAQGIEAATADETGTGSAVGESPVAESDAPETPLSTPLPSGSIER